MAFHKISDWKLGIYDFQLIQESTVRAALGLLAHRPTSSSQTFATVKSCTVSLNKTDSSHVPFLLNIQRRERSAQVKLSCLRGRLRRGERHFLSYFPDSKTWQTIEEAGLQASCSGRCWSINTAEAGTLWRLACPSDTRQKRKMFKKIKTNTGYNRLQNNKHPLSESYNRGRSLCLWQERASGCSAEQTHRCFFGFVTFLLNIKTKQFYNKRSPQL